MPLLQQALQRPQSIWLRRLLFQVHLWTGVAIGIYIFVISVTGAAIVFEEDMEHAIHADLTRTTRATSARADVQAVTANVQARYPHHRIDSILMPADDKSTIAIDLRRDTERLYAYASPASGEILGHRRRDGTFLHWLHDLHVNLLAGKTGRFFNGIGAILLFVLCMTGIVIWWPGLKNWKRALSVDWRKKWKRVNWDLHSATGFWLLAPITVWAITGAYFTWGEEFRRAIHAVSPLSQGLREPKSNIAMKGVEAPPSLNALIAVAQEQSPGMPLSRISLPSKEEGTIRVMMARGEIRDRRAVDNYYFDQYTGELLQKWERGVYRSAGDLVLYWIGPLHFGDFGGVWVKALWVVIGLSPALLFVTGFLMWWNRVLSKKWAKLKQSSRPRLTEASPLPKSST